MVDVITSLDALLEGAAARAGSAAAGSSLHQLVLIIADGRWVEPVKERVRAAHAACSSPHFQQSVCPFMSLLPCCPPPPGRFHEKESLRRMVRAAADRPGVLYAFIVLDNPANSILDMQVGVAAGGLADTAGQGAGAPLPAQQQPARGNTVRRRRAPVACHRTPPGVHCCSPAVAPGPPIRSCRPCHSWAASLCLPSTWTRSPSHSTSYCETQVGNACLAVGWQPRSQHALQPRRRQGISTL